MLASSTKWSSAGGRLLRKNSEISPNSAAFWAKKQWRVRNKAGWTRWPSESDLYRRLFINLIDEIMIYCYRCRTRGRPTKAAQYGSAALIIAPVFRRRRHLQGQCREDPGESALYFSAAPARFVQDRLPLKEDLTIKDFVP
jgi:hypothetical protein